VSVTADEVNLAAEVKRRDSLAGLMVGDSFRGDLVEVRGFEPLTPAVRRQYGPVP
jgi:hypothetical protein